MRENHENFNVGEKEFGKVYSKISAKNVSVYKTPEFIFIVANGKMIKSVEEIVQMQVFFREFKDQLEKYVEIHRKIWEEIEKIKGKKSIRGKDIDKIRFKLDSYDKTINLITHRINQMIVYVGTRASISKFMKIEEYLLILFNYRFEILMNTFRYVKKLWAMIKSHLQSAINLIVELQSKTTDASIKSLRLVTSVGVVSTLSRLVFTEEMPKLTINGVIYFMLLILASWIIDMVILQIYQRVKYKLKAKEKIIRF